MLRNILKCVFVILIAWPVMLGWLRLKVRNGDRLPRHGPAIVAANHNSHLDTLVLFALFPLSLIPRVRPVAAADYFMRSRVMAWFSQNVIGIISVDRTRQARGRDPLQECYAALDRDEILIIFPEGTRGEPESMTALKAGIARIAQRHVRTPVVTVFMRGLGNSMPKGTFVPIPLVVEVVLGEPFLWTGARDSFMAKLVATFDRLRSDIHASHCI
jgi:1-acyl-sn-glycerol-3-phosphate acyltransferase